MDQNRLLLQITSKGGKNIKLEVLPEDTMKNLKTLLTSVLDEDVNFNEALGSILNQCTFSDDTKVVDFFASQLTKNEEGVDMNQKIVGLEDQEEDDNLILSPMICAIPECPNNKFDSPEIKMFTFPQNNDMCKKWLDMTGLTEHLGQFSSEYLCKNVALCEEHFSQAQFLLNCSTLRSSAVPDLAESQLKTLEPIVESVISLDDASLVLPEVKEELLEGNENDPAPERYCRLCAQIMHSSEACVFLYENSGGINVADQINSSLPLSVSKNDFLPKQICNSCFNKLQSHYAFTLTCIEAEEQLRKMGSNLILAKGDPLYEERDTLRNYCCPLCVKGDMHFVSEPEVPENEPEISNVIVLDSKEAEEASMGLVSLEVASSELINDLASEAEMEDPENVPLATLASLPPQDQDQQKVSAQEEAEEEVGADFLIETRDRKAFEKAVFFQEDMVDWDFMCPICDEYFTEAKICLTHCLLHATDSYYPCVVCGLLFKTSEMLSGHFKEHKIKVSPTLKKQNRQTFSCETCNNSFNSRKDFIMHKCSDPKGALLPLTSNLLTGYPNCQECALYFRSEERSDAHKKAHSEGCQALLSCDQCHEYFEWQGMLDYHKKVIHETPPVFQCSSCPLQFYLVNQMTTHRKVHTSTVFQCSICGEFFAKIKSINEHMEIHGAGKKKREKGLHCTPCGKAFLSRRHFAYHMEVAHGPRSKMPSLIQYECKICEARFPESQDVLEHRTAHWKPTDPNLPHLCEYCGEPHPSPNALAKHRRLLHPEEKPYICTVCELRTRTLYEARIHRKTHTEHHSSMAMDTEENGEIEPGFGFSCDNCMKSFISEDALIAHRLSHEKCPSAFYCQQCSKSFMNKAAMIAHCKTHLPGPTSGRKRAPVDREKAGRTLRSGNEYLCDKCDKRFPEKNRLIVHLRSHTGEKPYQCGFCGKTFAQVSAMYMHALIHTGEKPHECDICGMKFRVKADRDGHRRKHTGERPFKCEYCLKTFRASQVYYQHMMIHRNERRYVCEICNRAFHRSHTLTVHRRIHTGEKPNICDFCGKGFRQRSDLMKHRRNIHDEGKN